MASQDKRVYTRFQSKLVASIYLDSEQNIDRPVSPGLLEIYHLLLSRDASGSMLYVGPHRRGLGHPFHHFTALEDREILAKILQLFLDSYEPFEGTGTAQNFCLNTFQVLQQLSF